MILELDLARGPNRGVSKSSYSSSARKILEFDTEFFELSSSSLSSQVQVLQYLTQVARELNRVLLFY